MPRSPEQPSVFTERLWPRWWVCGLLSLGGGLALGLLLLRPLGGPGFWTGATLGLGLTLLLLALTATSVQVRAGTLRAGRAAIDGRHLGAVQVLDVAQMRVACGPGLDARAYLCLRGWAGSGVKVTVEDAADPTPYWLISTRRPEQLARALRRPAARGGPSAD